MIKLLLKLTVYLALLGGAVVIALGGSFAIYGWSKGYSVSSAISYLLTADELAESNLKVEQISWSRVSWAGHIQNKRLAESSGLASSNRYDQVLWSMNDSGNAPELFALSTQGDDLGTWTLEETVQSDWEALSDFVLDGQPYLLIADVGDNFRWKPVHSLIVVKEPDVGQPEERTISEEWRIDFSYPDGVFRDCEAVAVDQSRDRVLLLTKRVHPPELYSLPLKASSSAVAQKISDLFHLPRATHADVKEEPRIGKYRRMVTGMDVSEDDLLLTTYQDLYLYKLSRLEEAPVMVRMPLTGQREAVAFDRRSSLTAYVTNERRGGFGAADVFKIELPEF